MGMLAVFLMLMFDASASSVDQTNFERALAKAHQMEATLSEAEQANLFQAQGQFIVDTFSGCINKTGSPPEEFTVVVELQTDGTVNKAWRQGDGFFVKCFEREMIHKFTFKAPDIPFYTAIEYSNEDKIEFNYD
ncbi:hypothetical protein [Kangiella sediminilitoris]|uniref:Uncharacterized protein n=1 Tax=Kangiella sediminilitoris TaxID=1144748 RepID=A0A1B3B9U4_9GAMM|nr:hypothetical protein [Kangiella sediminilitoris]AOE49563.1 hypothetical protein KS2013_841 [Kangiella sediminilitoris]